MYKYGRKQRLVLLLFPALIPSSLIISLPLLLIMSRLAAAGKGLPARPGCNGEMWNAMQLMNPGSDRQTKGKTGTTQLMQSGDVKETEWNAYTHHPCSQMQGFLNCTSFFSSPAYITCPDHTMREFPKTPIAWWKESGKQHLFRPSCDGDVPIAVATCGCGRCIPQDDRGGGFVLVGKWVEGRCCVHVRLRTPETSVRHSSVSFWEESNTKDKTRLWSDFVIVASQNQLR